MEDKEFIAMTNEEKIRTICSYFSMQNLDNDSIVMQRLKWYIEAYHEVGSLYSQTDNNDKTIEKELKLLRIPMDSAKAIMNDGENHPVVDFLVLSDQKTREGSFDKNFSLVRKKPGIPTTIEEEYIPKMNGFTLLMVMLITSILVTIFLTIFYAYLINK